jgi:uncharacterized protein (DUF1501 family)
MLLDRRELLRGAIAMGSVLAIPRLAWGDEVAPRARPLRTLVFLHLNGGNDGLNTVIPHRDPRYRAFRPSLAIDLGQVRKISDDLGLHPGLQGFEALWRRDRLAIVNGVGYPDPNYSHFRATEIWFTAEPDRTPTYGWIGRALDRRASEKPLRAVAIEKQAPLSFAGASPGLVTMTDFSRFRVPPGMSRAAALWPGYRDLAGARGEVGAAGTQALEVAERIARLQPERANLYGSLGTALGKVLALLKADLDLECVQLSFGGFDTHAAQAGQHARLLTELGNNLDRYQQALEAAGIGEKSVLVVFSEFGRRVKENLSAGTDHGSAGPLFLVGQGVAPGFHGAYPSLEDLDGDNFVFTTDFRRVYAALLRECFDLDPPSVVGSFEPLELFA